MKIAVSVGISDVQRCNGGVMVFLRRMAILVGLSGKTIKKTIMKYR